MGIQTKIIASFLSMLSCVSVMTTGVVAILYNNDIQFTNNETISFREVSGDLYGYRIGGGNEDIYDIEAFIESGDVQPVWLYTNGQAVDDSHNYFEKFFKNVGFRKNAEGDDYETQSMYYVYKYVLDKASESDVWVSMEHKITSAYYEETYLYYFGEVEPEIWDTTENTEVKKIDKTLVVNVDSNVLWLYAGIRYNPGGHTAVDHQSLEFNTHCTWEYKFFFDSNNVV